MTKPTDPGGTDADSTVTDSTVTDSTVTDSTVTDSTGPIAFSQAMDELESIVAELEADQMDVDLLAERVERAAFLIGHCRDRLDHTRFRVEEIIVRLDGSADTDTDTDTDTDADPDPAVDTDPAFDASPR